MEEDFQLISKDKLKKLEEENAKLKEELAKKPKTTKGGSSAFGSTKKQQENIIKKIVAAVKDESQKEREIILTNLTEIKNLNKTTLDNLLSNTQTLDSKLEEMVDTISNLVGSLKQVVKKLTDFENNSIKEEVKKIRELKLDKGLEKTNKTLVEIDLFMQNLRTLLSYVKPNDVRIDLPARKQTMPKPSLTSSSINDLEKLDTNLGTSTNLGISTPKPATMPQQTQMNKQMPSQVPTQNQTPASAQQQTQTQIPTPSITQPKGNMGGSPLPSMNQVNAQNNALNQISSQNLNNKTQQKIK